MNKNSRTCCYNAIYFHSTTEESFYERTKGSLNPPSQMLLAVMTDFHCQGGRRRRTNTLIMAVTVLMPQKANSTFKENRYSTRISPMHCYCCKTWEIAWIYRWLRFLSCCGHSWVVDQDCEIYLPLEKGMKSK